MLLVSASGRTSNAGLRGDISKVVDIASGEYIHLLCSFLLETISLQSIVIMHATDDVMATFKNIPSFPDDVPTAPLLRISLQKLLDSNSEELRRLWSACTELGFFYLDLRNVKSDNGTLDGNAYVQEADRLFDVSEEFFSLPVDEKSKYDFKDQGSYFGYKGYGGGITDKKGTPDRNEFYNASLPYTWLPSMI